MYCITLQNSLQFGSIVCIVLHWVRGVCPSVISVGITEGRLRVHLDGDDVLSLALRGVTLPDTGRGPEHGFRQGQSVAGGEDGSLI